MNQWQKCEVKVVEYHFVNSKSIIEVNEPLWWRFEEVLGEKFEFYLEKNGACCQVPSGWDFKVVIPYVNDVTPDSPGSWQIVFYDGSKG